MSYITNLDGNEFFDGNYTPIRVMLAEHKTRNVSYHTHSFYEFVYIDQGFSTHFYNNTTTLVTSGDIFGMRPGDVHGYICPKNAILYNCVFDLEVLSEELNKICELQGIEQIFDCKTPPVWHRIHLDPLSQKEAVTYLKRMKNEGDNRRPGWDLKLKGLLMEFLVLFSRCYSDQFTKENEGEYRYNQYMYKALGYIEEHYTQSILVEEIACYIGLSTDYFSRMFKQFTGLSPVEYIKSVRMAKASELLRQQEISIADVAMKVGFEDPGYFARQFKRVLGISPSMFQRENNILYNKKLKEGA